MEQQKLNDYCSSLAFNLVFCRKEKVDVKQFVLTQFTHQITWTVFTVHTFKNSENRTVNDH